MEALERRVGWLGLAIGVVLVWATLAGGGFVGRIKTWELIVFLSALFCLVAAGALIAAAMAPGGAVRTARAVRLLGARPVRARARAARGA
jgi:hypothetical protein